MNFQHSALLLVAALALSHAVVEFPDPSPACVDNDSGASTLLGADCAGVALAGLCESSAVQLTAHALCPVSCDACRRCADDDAALAASLLFGPSCEAATEEDSNCDDPALGSALSYFCPVSCGDTCFDALPADCVDRDDVLAEIGFTFTCDQAPANLGACGTDVIAAACPLSCGFCQDFEVCEDQDEDLMELNGYTCDAVEPLSCNDPLEGDYTRFFCPETCECCDDSAQLSLILGAVSCDDIATNPELCTTDPSALYVQAICRRSCDSCARDCEDSTAAEAWGCEIAGAVAFCADPFLGILYRYYCPELCSVQQVCDLATPSPSRPPTPSALPSPSPSAPGCENDDAGIANIAAQVPGGSFVNGCFDIPSSYCQHSTYGSTIRQYCPLLCGYCSVDGDCAIDSDSGIAALTAQAGYSFINTCALAYQYAGTNPCGGEYAQFMLQHCPCTCAENA